MKFDQCKKYSYNTVIIGSGVAGLNAAIHYVEEGGNFEDIAIITEQLGAGTSFNTGADKQTYYKLSISGNQNDSPIKMAEAYYNGGSMHGDLALIESVNSIREFMHLVSLGVQFPYNKYGSFIGYKTDNDPLQRATSIGPLTSQVMSEKLLNRVKNLQIRVFDNTYCIKIIENMDKHIVIGINTSDLEKKFDPDLPDSIMNIISIFNANHIIVATGGSSGIYTNTVYPKSQWGALGLLIETECETQNLTESQFGLASTEFRWNVSGTYQQVLPRYISLNKRLIESLREDRLSIGSYIKENPDSAKEFLNEHFSSPENLLNSIFLKGYQWPFNSERIMDYGSSTIDLLVFEENIMKNRCVFLDYSQNPYGMSLDKLFSHLNDETRTYLENSGISNTKKFETPIDRLIEINPKAYKLYLDNLIDLQKNPLEIAVCAQHCNGGIAGDIWWETSKKGIFVIGEANGSHGVHRPGGSALNSAQVGGLRAILRITHHYNKQKKNQNQVIDNSIKANIEKFLEKLESIINREPKKPSNNLKPYNVYISNINKRMDKYGTIIRNVNGLSSQLKEIAHEIETYFDSVLLGEKTLERLINVLKIYDALITHGAYLNSIQRYIEENGGSRGSYLIIPKSSLPKRLIKVIQIGKKEIKFVIRNEALDEKLIKSKFNKTQSKVRFETFLENRRPIPKTNDWFEIVWKEYENRRIFE